MASRAAPIGAACLALLAACASAQAAGRSDRPDPKRFLASSPKAHVARLVLVAGLGDANNGFNFDGYGRGELLVTVPVGWRLVVDCVNRSGGRNSCAVVSGPLETRPAFRGASTTSPLRGLAPGASETFSFRASRVGSFRIASLVPGHEQARQWAVLDVVRGGRPSISARPGPA